MAQSLPALLQILPLTVDTQAPRSPSPVSPAHGGNTPPDVSPVGDSERDSIHLNNLTSSGQAQANTPTAPTNNQQQNYPAQQSPPAQQPTNLLCLSPPNAPNAPSSPLLTQNASPGSQGPKVIRAIHWWWWWDIGAALLSVVSMCLIMAVLFIVANKPLDNWKQPIQPNSLIAVFTTIGHTAMMVPVASCVSQLKWHHFQRRPQKLSHIQLFEEASRGPWGAFILLIGVRSRALLAWSFAIITIIALGIEPSAQQILSFETRPTLVNNGTTAIGRADRYSSRAFQETQYNCM